MSESRTQSIVYANYLQQTMKVETYSRRCCIQISIHKTGYSSVLIIHSSMLFIHTSTNYMNTNIIDII